MSPCRLTTSLSFHLQSPYFVFFCFFIYLWSTWDFMTDKLQKKLIMVFQSSLINFFIQSETVEYVFILFFLSNISPHSNSLLFLLYLFFSKLTGQFIFMLKVLTCFLPPNLNCLISSDILSPTSTGVLVSVQLLY